MRDYNLLLYIAREPKFHKRSSKKTFLNFLCALCAFFVFFVTFMEFKSLGVTKDTKGARRTRRYVVGDNAIRGEDQFIKNIAATIFRAFR